MSRENSINLGNDQPGAGLEMFHLALLVLDKLDELVAMIEYNPLGIDLMDENPPQRIRIKKREAPRLKNMHTMNICIQRGIVVSLLQFALALKPSTTA